MFFSVFRLAICTGISFREQQPRRIEVLTSRNKRLFTGRRPTKDDDIRSQTATYMQWPSAEQTATRQTEMTDSDCFVQRPR